MRLPRLAGLAVPTLFERDLDLYVCLTHRIYYLAASDLVSHMLHPFPLSSPNWRQQTCKRNEHHETEH